MQMTEGDHEDSLEGSGGSCVCERHERGQSTVEYALVLLAFLSMSIAFAAMWHAGRDGKLLNLAVGASSHQLGGSDPLGAARDLALF
jgi:hypothetical protein